MSATIGERIRSALRGFGSGGPFWAFARLKLCRLGVAALLLLLIPSCVETNPPATAEAPPAAPLRPAVTSPRVLAISPEPIVPPPAPPAVVVHSGTGVFVQPAAAAVPKVDGDGQPGDITLNFVDTDVREVLRSVLGDLLHLNYTIDSKVQATVTVQTSRPLKPADVLPVLQQVLRASGLTLIDSNGIIRVTPSEDAQRAGGLPVTMSGGQPAGSVGAYTVQILPLRYAAATDMQQTIEPFLPKGTAARADAARNLLLLTGGTQDLGSVVEMVRSFDVDWLAGMSYAILPLRTGSARAIAAELTDIFGPNGSMPLPGLLRFAPLERMNAILAVSPQRAYVEQARQWIDRLDRGADDNSPRIYRYHVQNSRAADLAKVLSELLTSGQVRTIQAQTAPGTQMAQIGGASGSYGSGGAGSLSGGIGAPAGGQSGGLSAGSGLGGLATQAQPTPAVTGPPSAGTDSIADLASSAPSGSGSGSGAGAAPPGLDLPAVRVVADEKTNTLAIFARPRDFRMIESALEQFDIVPLQVLIQATIAEVTLTNELQYGLQYFFKSGSSQALFVANAAAAVIPPIAPVLPGFNYVFSGANSNVVLNLLASLTNVHVISSPELLVLDHQTASLVVGNEVPIPTSQITYATSGAPVTGNNIQYIDTGVVLHVAPRVNANGLITLEISQEVSDVSSAPAVNSPVGAPTIEQRRIQSTITVQDGETIALGGLITDSKSNNRTGIPLLSDIPVVGALFRSTDIMSNRTELLILLSPKVLHNPSEARDATEELKSRLHALQSAPVSQ